MISSHFCRKGKKTHKQNYSNKFHSDFDQITKQVDNFNSRENDSQIANQNITSNKKILLKKMTEPKYYQMVAGMIQKRQKSVSALVEIDRKNSRYGLSPLDKPEIVTANKKFGNFQQSGDFQQSGGEISKFFIRGGPSERQKDKSMELRSNILKKQYKLEREWEKTENFRSHNSIYFTSKPWKAHRREEAIIRRVQMRRPNTSSAQFTDRTTSVMQTEPNCSYGQ